MSQRPCRDCYNPPMDARADDLARFAARFASAKGPDEQAAIWADYTEWERERRERLSQLYPPNPPNPECHHAVLQGLRLSNTAGFQPGDLTPYMSLPGERVLIWTHTEHTLSSLVSLFPIEAFASPRLVKTAASCLELAVALTSAFEQLVDFKYWWIYRFDPRVSIDAQEFFGFAQEENALAVAEIRQGLGVDLHFLPERATIVDLLWTDDAFFVSSQHLYASLKAHWICLTCELGQDPIHDHRSEDPEPWEKVQVHPHLDIALVQAFRAIEALLGQPGRPARAEERWRAAVLLEPHARFERSGTTHLEYFEQAYKHRNEAAHGRGHTPFDVTRRHVIDAQCFAWLVLNSYAHKHVAKGSQLAVSFEPDVVARDVPGSITAWTYPAEVAEERRRALREIYHDTTLNPSYETR